MQSIEKNINFIILTDRLTKKIFHNNLALLVVIIKE